MCKLYWALFGGLPQQVDNELICGEHYSSVGNLPNELWNESSIKSSVALLHCHQAGRLEKVFIFAALFSQPRPNDLWGGKTGKTVSDHQKKKSKNAEHRKCDKGQSS